MRRENEGQSFYSLSIIKTSAWERQFNLMNLEVSCIFLPYWINKIFQNELGEHFASFLVQSKRCLPMNDYVGPSTCRQDLSFYGRAGAGTLR